MAYNTPKNQMKRYEKAGLNPHLIYGQGSNGNASPAPSMNAPHFESPMVNFPDTMNVLTQYLQSKILNEEATKKKFETGITKENYIREWHLNNIDFGNDRQRNIGTFGKGLFGHASIDGDNPNRLELIKGLELNDKKAANRILNINADTQKEYREKTNFALEQLGKIRQSEAGMSDSLKEWNLNAQDPVYARLLAKLLEQTSFKNIFKPR